jgi:hypothetical protein
LYLITEVVFATVFEKIAITVAYETSARAAGANYVGVFLEVMQEFDTY